MYGIVNRAIEDLIVQHHGQEKWEAVRKRSGVDIDFFLSNEPYDDAVTFQLAIAASEELKQPLSEILIAFGEWWVLKTGMEKYGGLMHAGGDNLREFLLNLPMFHNRIMLIYPKLTPPEFRVESLGDRLMDVHYYSERDGLQDFVYGLLQGLGKMYQENPSITLLQSRNEGATHEVFRISW
jgi:hypothetical protein